MAFFATIEDLPAAKESWRDKPPKPPDPPVPPPPDRPKPPRVRYEPPPICTGMEYMNGLDMGYSCMESMERKGWKIPQGMIIYRRVLDEAEMASIPPDRLVWRAARGATGGPASWWVKYGAGDEELIQSQFPA